MPGWRSGWPGWNGSSVVTATSSMPPSTDDLPGRKAPLRKTGKRSERRRGKQPGAAGAGLPRVDNPDETVQVFPETCADCGAGLADGTDAGVTGLTDCNPARQLPDAVDVDGGFDVL